VIPLSMVSRARDSLAKNGARVTLATYEGGHGWYGDVYGNISAGLLWLERQTTMTADNATGKTGDD